MDIWTYLLLAAAILVFLNMLLAWLLARSNAGERFAQADEPRLRSR